MSRKYAYFLIVWVLFAAFHAKAVTFPVPMGVEILLAQDSSSSMNTRFGHSMIRLVDEDEIWSNDLVFSFGYEVVESDPAASKLSEIFGAISGNYQLKMNIMTLGEAWNRYELSEQRNLSRVILATNSQIRKKIVETLMSWSERPELLGNYSLLGNNCVSILIDLLKNAGVPLRRTGIIKPNSFVRNLYESGATWMAPLKFKSKKSVLKELQLEESDLSLPFTENQFVRILATWTEEEIQTLLAYNIKLSTKMIREIRRLRGIALNRETIELRIGHQQLPKLAYSLCNSNECSANKREALRTRLGDEYLRMSKKLVSRYPNYRLIRRNGEDENPRRYYYPVSKSQYLELYKREYQSLKIY